MLIDSRLAGSIKASIIDAERFVDRCNSALTFARQFGEAAWKIEGLEEALVDARDALADMKRLGV